MTLLGKTGMRRSGPAMAYWALNMCFMFMVWVVFATFHMQVHATTNDHKHVRRELVDEIPGMHLQRLHFILGNHITIFLKIYTTCWIDLFILWQDRV